MNVIHRRSPLIWLSTRSISFLSLIGLVFFIPLYPVKKKFLSVESLYLASVKINARCIEVRDKVPYPNINFIGEPFRRGFVAGFTRICPQVRLISNVFHEQLSGYSGKAIYGTDFAYLENNLDWRRLTPRDIPLVFSNIGHSFPLVLDLQTSIWEQSLRGSYSLFLGDQKWHKGRVKVISKHVIKDEYSPYISTYDEIFGIYPEGTHREEIEKIYTELGERVGEQIGSLLVSKPKKISPKKKKKKKPMGKRYQKGKK